MTSNVSARTEKWRDTIDNLVTTAGKNLLLDSVLAGEDYTAVGPFIGLISGVDYGVGPVVGDSMASHAGWAEAGDINARPIMAPAEPRSGIWRSMAPRRSPPRSASRSPAPASRAASW
jgi:hypothetical protein